MTTSRNFAPATIYHIYNRGNKKEKVFYDSQDFHYYLNAFFKCSKESDFTPLCYCLMDNHYHFCCRQNTEVTPSKLMLRVNTAYAMYFNKKYKQVGHIFQGRYKAKPVQTDSYLAYLSMYIHANPAGKGLGNIQEYEYSSFKEYASGEEKYCNHKPVLNQFNGSHLEYFIYTLKFKEDRHGDALSSRIANYSLDDESKV